MRALFRGPVGAMVALVGAVILQTTLFGRVRLAGLAPDLVMIVTILMTIRLRNEPALLVAFLGGLLMDSLSSTALGLRALVYTAVTFLAIRTRERADSGPFAVALWVGALSLVGIALLLMVGTLFAQYELSGGEAMRRLLLVPIFNFLTALILSPVTARLLHPARRGPL